MRDGPVHQTTSDPDPEEIEELENEDEIDNVMMAEVGVGPRRPPVREKVLTVAASVACVGR